MNVEACPVEQVAQIEDRWTFSTDSFIGLFIFLPHLKPSLIFVSDDDIFLHIIELDCSSGCI